MTYLKKCSFLMVFNLVFLLLSCEAEQPNQESIEIDIEDKMENPQNTEIEGFENQNVESSGVAFTEETSKEDVVQQLVENNDESEGEIEEKIDESPNKDKTCSDLLKEIRLALDEYEASTEKDIETVSEQFKAWGKDIIFQNCRKSIEYREDFSKLSRRLRALQKAARVKE